MQPAFVLGNGKSRLVLDLPRLQEKGVVYGCNALYRSFTPDCLIATDPGIAREIQNSSYAKKNRFHTRRPFPDSGAKNLPKKYKGFSSGPNAVAQALLDGYQHVYLIGFDLGTTDGIFNNIYADTEHYKKITDPPTFAGNWIKQIKQLAEEYNHCQFVRVQGPESAYVSVFNTLPNMTFLTVEKFRQQLKI